MVNIEEMAPDFCLKNQNDEDVCLNDFRGKWTIVYFYPKDNTPGCTLEAKNFSNHSKEFQQKNTNILGISPDSSQSHKKFEDKNNLKITLLSDPEYKTLKDYDVWKPKKMYGKEFMGVIRSTFLIDPDGKISYIWPKVKVPGHIEDVKKIIEDKQGEL